MGAVAILVKHAPVRRCVITIRPAAPWYTEEIKSEKRIRRRFERRWRATRSASDREKLLLSSRSNYYSTLIAENRHDLNLRKLFSTFSKLLHQSSETRFPQYDSVTSLVQDFIAFFGNKIKKICDDLDRSILDNGLQFSDVVVGYQFTAFANVLLNELKPIVGSMHLKSSDLDPLLVVL